MSKWTESSATRRGGFRRAPRGYSCAAVGTYDGVIRVLGNELGYIKSTACNTLAASVDRGPGSATPATTTDQLSD